MLKSTFFILLGCVFALPTFGQQSASWRVTLSDKQASSLKIDEYEVRGKKVFNTIRVPAVVEPAPSGIEFVAAPISGRVTKIYAHEGERVEQGSPLLELESLALAELNADYIKSKAEVGYFDLQAKRLLSLTEENIATRQEYEKALADQKRAQAGLIAAKAKLLAVGLVPETLDDRMNALHPRAALLMRAKQGGIVNQHLISLGQAVSENQFMMDIIDPSSVLVRALVNPEQLHLLRPGLNVELFTKPSASLSITASINSINPALDAESKSGVLNIIVANKNGLLIPGSQIEAELNMETVDSIQHIPASSVAFVGDISGVFVKHTDKEWVFTPVQVNNFQNEFVEISQAIGVGDIIASSHLFDLKALLQMN